MTSSTYLIDRYITMMRANYELQNNMLILNSTHEQHLYNLLSGSQSISRRPTNRAPSRRPTPVGLNVFDLTNLFQNVPVTPTNNQITTATREAIYGTISNPPNTQCPITQNEFNHDDTITQIIHCRHCFNATEINRWWRTSPRCPICRYDIREYNDSSGSSASELPASSSTNTLPVQTNNSTSISTTPFEVYVQLTNEYNNTTDSSEESINTPRRRPSV